MGGRSSVPKCELGGDAAELLGQFGVRTNGLVLRNAHVAHVADTDEILFGWCEWVGKGDRGRWNGWVGGWVGNGPCSPGYHTSEPQCPSRHSLALPRWKHPGGGCRKRWGGRGASSCSLQEALFRTRRGRPRPRGLIRGPPVCFGEEGGWVGGWVGWRETMQ